MEQFEIYIVLFGAIVIIGQLFKDSSIPISLLLVMTGMLLSLLPAFPHINLDSTLVLHIFLPLLVYQISSFSSWRDVKKDLRPITLLSVGHVVFITFVVAIVAHALIPQFSWPMAFILGAVVSPPDTVAIVSIAEKVYMPERLVTILEGEGMFNDAAALTLFRFALAALMTNHFSAINAVSTFFAVVILETLYGLLLGYIIGYLRLKIRNSMLHIIASVLTPFLAYIPAEKFGGSGILATVVTGFIIGNYYALRYTPEFRLVSRTVWPALSFAIQSFLFLLLGLNMELILDRISSIPIQTLLSYSIAIILTVIIGRFIWVFPEAYIPRFLFPFIRRREHHLPWKYPFIISWAGMRGAISLAAALAIPSLPVLPGEANTKDLLIFLVFCVIAATLLLQGLTLPWLLKITGISQHGVREQYNQHLSELNARVDMIEAVLHWLMQHKKEIRDNQKLLDEVELRIKEYQMLKLRLEERIIDHNNHNMEHDEKQEIYDEIVLLTQINDIERSELLRLWRQEKININIRNKLLDQLDHGSKRLPVS